MRLLPGLTTAVLVTMLAPAPARADTSPAGPGVLLAAIGPASLGVPGARGAFEARPPSGTPTGVSDTTVPAFPTGGAFVVLSTGDATLADPSNDSPKTTGDNGGGATRDGAERDVVTLRIDFTTVAPACVVTFEYAFLSEEYPEWVGQPFGDAFVAELDATTWSAAYGEVTAPNAFVLETAGRSVLTAPGATGTTYDGGTGPALARVLVPASGPHSLYLSVFDVGDNRYDSAVLLDNLVLC